jgi:hypothetical protein
LAAETLRELAPLLAEDGIDVANLDAVDEQTLWAALTRAVERHNMALFTPVGRARELAVTTLRQAVATLAAGDGDLAAQILEQAQPESPNNAAPTVSACIGIALGLLDNWLGGQDPNTPPQLSQRIGLPSGHWPGQRAARDILALAGKARAFSSLEPLLTRQGGHDVLYGSALAITATLQTWSLATDTPVPELARNLIR